MLGGRALGLPGLIPSRGEHLGGRLAPSLVGSLDAIGRDARSLVVSLRGEPAGLLLRLGNQSRALRVRRRKKREHRIKLGRQLGCPVGRNPGSAGRTGSARRPEPVEEVTELWQPNLRRTPRGPRLRPARWLTASGKERGAGERRQLLVVILVDALTVALAQSLDGAEEAGRVEFERVAGGRRARGRTGRRRD